MPRHRLSKRRSDSRTSFTLNSGSAISASRALAERVGQQVELLVSCRDLVDLDVFSRSDPMCVLLVRQFGQWREYARTEAIRESLNPGFTKSFFLDFEPEIEQPLMFSVYDIDSSSSELKDHDHVGSVEVRLSDLVRVDREIYTTDHNLRVPGDPQSRGLLLVTSEFVRHTRCKLQAHVAAHHLNPQGLFKRKPDAFLEIGRQLNSITFHPVFRTEIFSRSCNPWWRPFEVSVQKLCNDDWDRPIRLSVWQTDFRGTSKSSYDVIGQVTMTLHQLSDLKREGNYKRLEMVCPKRERQNKKNTRAGSLRIYQFHMESQYSLLDYIRGGLQLRLIVAIDFTSSNGSTGEMFSLHNTTASNPNPYQMALQTVGGALARYDLEQKIATFGFGARRSGLDLATCHCFPLLDESGNRWLRGIKGVLEAYERMLPTLAFGGPTFLTPLLATVTDLISMATPETHYHVLLVVTDGVVNDLDAATRQLVEASCLPLTVVFLGVGPADFSLMSHLHSSPDTLLVEKGSKRKAERENTFFSPVRPHLLSQSGVSKVVQEALGAVSRQALTFLRSRGVTPDPPFLQRADPSASWVDADHPLDPPEPIANGGPGASIEPRTLKASASMPNLDGFLFNDHGPVCPTCGASLTVQGQGRSQPTMTS